MAAAENASEQVSPASRRGYEAPAGSSPQEALTTIRNAYEEIGVETGVWQFCWWTRRVPAHPVFADTFLAAIYRPARQVATPQPLGWPVCSLSINPPCLCGRVWTHGVLRPRRAARRCDSFHQYFEWPLHGFLLLLCLSTPRREVTILSFLPASCCHHVLTSKRDERRITFPRNAKHSSLWTPGAWYWMLLLLAGLEAMAGALYLVFFPVSLMIILRPLS